MSTVDLLPTGYVTRTLDEKQTHWECISCRQRRKLGRIGIGPSGWWAVLFTDSVDPDCQQFVFVCSKKCREAWRCVTDKSYGVWANRLDRKKKNKQASSGEELLHSAIKRKRK